MKSDREQLKIGFDAKRLFNNNTGLGNYSRTLVKNLQKEFPQHEYHLFANNIGLDGIASDFLDGNFIVHQPNAISSRLWRTIGMSKIINAEKLDIFHGLSHEIPLWINTSIKTVVTFHDLIYEIHPRLFNYFDRKAYQIKYKSSATRADCIIAISNQTKQDLINNYQIETKKIETVYQSLSDTFINTPQNNLKGEYFLFVGSIIERKGLQYIIEALNITPLEYRKNCVIIGNGPYKAECEELINDYGLSAYFHFMGNVSNDLLPKYYDKCIALVLPSIHEGFGIPIIEALSRKKPVITTENSAMSEAAGPGGIFVAAKDISQISKAMIKIQNEDTNLKLGSKGYEYVNKNFNSRLLSQQLMEVYYNLIK